MSAKGTVVGVAKSSSSSPAKTATLSGLPAKTYTVPLPSITSIFAPPTSCFSQFFETTISNTKVWQIFPSFKPECFPPRISGGATFSPGICPSGFSTAQVTVYAVGKSTVATSTATGTADETHATCCPTGFTVNSAGDLCEATGTETAVFKSTPGVFVSSGASGVTTFTSARYTRTQFPASSTGKVIAPAFVVEYGSQNVIITSLLASQAANHGGDSGADDGAAPNGPLTGGQIAGIVVGITAFVFIVSAIIWWKMFRASKRQRHGSTAGTEDGVHWHKAELAATEAGPKRRGTLPQELPGDTLEKKEGEEDVTLAPVELPGDTPPRANGPTEMPAIGTPVVETAQRTNGYSVTNAHQHDGSLTRDI